MQRILAAVLLMLPVTSMADYLDVIKFWVGRSANAADFGKAWDTWRDAQANADSVPAKLNPRFDACSTNVSRSGYESY